MPRPSSAQRRQHRRHANASGCLPCQGLFSRTKVMCSILAESVHFEERLCIVRDIIKLWADGHEVVVSRKGEIGNRKEGVDQIVAASANGDSSQKEARISVTFAQVHSGSQAADKEFKKPTEKMKCLSQEFINQPGDNSKIELIIFGDEIVTDNEGDDIVSDGY
ncbi:Glutamyl-tRNA(Gln) amidotransferase subunit A, mitochondrial [Frankliniella fusca]|uniref:Glutamyl-tRNA(Gln) amidotransferase subunit A, mitochondrial n=1 Tax=Frankliniella fusca TaxID=407009 RepID=A0AAE1GZ96_9NEOP|nr:Glutamyl-tRNA(Gln) amidotransferase subunit A, mitochondrial [Frankliniella fusca]